LFGDTADLGRYIETFVVESWAEHLRQHERMTVVDREVRNRAIAFHIGAAPPMVSHFISAMPGKTRANGYSSYSLADRLEGGVADLEPYAAALAYWTKGNISRPEVQWYTTCPRSRVKAVRREKCTVASCCYDVQQSYEDEDNDSGIPPGCYVFPCYARGLMYHVPVG
jgi:hypothetical protein